MLKIIVFVKQVVDISQIKFDTDGVGILQNTAGGEINPFDLNALELAVQIKDKLGASITTISMGESGADAILRDTMSRGATDTLLLEDAAFKGSDTIATSYTLASAVKKLGEFDLIICGEKTVDGDTGQVGPEIAEYLNIPHVAYVSSVEYVGEKLVLVSDMDNEQHTIECGFPILLTVTKNINTPRLPSLRDKLNSRKAKVTVWHAEDLSSVADLNLFGEQGSANKLEKMLLPPEGGRKGKTMEGSAEEIVKKLVDELEKDGILRGINTK
jgi:electron transfer flavoprotein beta subunit